MRDFKVLVCLEILRFPFEEQSKSEVTTVIICFHFSDTKSSTRKL